MGTIRFCAVFGSHRQRVWSCRVRVLRAGRSRPARRWPHEQRQYSFRPRHHISRESLRSASDRERHGSSFEARPADSCAGISERSIQCPSRSGRRFKSHRACDHRVQADLSLDQGNLFRRSFPVGNLGPPVLVRFQQRSELHERPVVDVRSHVRLIRFAVVSGKSQDLGIRRCMDHAAERTFPEHPRPRSGASHHGCKLPRLQGERWADAVLGRTSPYLVHGVSHEAVLRLGARPDLLRGDFFLHAAEESAIFVQPRNDPRHYNSAPRESAWAVSSFLRSLGERFPERAAACWPSLLVLLIAIGIHNVFQSQLHPVYHNGNNLTRHVFWTEVYYGLQSHPQWSTKYASTHLIKGEIATGDDVPMAAVLMYLD